MEQSHLAKGAVPMEVEASPSPGELLGLDKRAGPIRLITRPLEMAADLATGGAVAGEPAPSGSAAVGST